MHHELVAVGVVGPVAPSPSRKKDRPKVRHIRRLSQNRKAVNMREMRFRHGLDLVSLQTYLAQKVIDGLAILKVPEGTRVTDEALSLAAAEALTEYVSKELRARGYR